MKMNVWILYVAMAALLSGITPDVRAQDTTNIVETMTDWSLFEYPPICTNENEGEKCRQPNEKPIECWSVSAPKETLNTRDGQPVSEQRGDVLLFVTFRPGQQGEISFSGGYPFADAPIRMDVNGTTFELFSEGDWAWPGTPEDDARMLAAMMNSSSAILTAMSANGIQSRDTFSLRGFSTAMEESAKRCQ